MNRKRLEEIKKHMRIHAPKSIHKELAELFAYIKKLEGFSKVAETQKQGSLLGNVFDWQMNLVDAYDKGYDVFRRYYTQLGLKESDALEQMRKARRFLNGTSGS